MIKNDEELRAMTERITRFQLQVERLRQVETNPANYRSSASGFLAEIDRMQLEIREYLSIHPGEVGGGNNETEKPSHGRNEHRKLTDGTAIRLLPDPHLKDGMAA